MFWHWAAGNHLHCDAGVQCCRKEPVPSGIEPHLGQGDLHRPWVWVERSVGPHVPAESLQVPQGTLNLSPFVFSCIRYLAAASIHICSQQALQAPQVASGKCSAAAGNHTIKLYQVHCSPTAVQPPTAVSPSQLRSRASPGGRLTSSQVT